MYEKNPIETCEVIFLDRITNASILVVTSKWVTIGIHLAYGGTYTTDISKRQLDDYCVTHRPILL